MTSRAELVTLYEGYLSVCNRHAFAELTDLVHDRLLVNGEPRTATDYVADLGRVVEAFPDYRWTLRRMVVEVPWLAVHLVDTGTHLGPWLGRPPSGAHVSTDEFAIYRVEEGRIAEVSVTADNERLLRSANA